jgi:hypothetical protein
MFLLRSGVPGYRRAMPELRPATAEEIEDALVFALRFDGRKRVHQGDEFMASQAPGAVGLRRDEGAALQGVQHPENGPGEPLV